MRDLFFSSFFLLSSLWDPPHGRADRSPLLIVVVLAPVVQRLDNAIQRISVNKANHAIRWIVIYPVDSVIQPLNNRGLIYIHKCAPL